MRLWFTVFVALLLVMTAGDAGAEWAYYAAKPQPFQVFDSHVIAVGTAGNLEPVQASDIEKALEDGKEIRLRYAEIEGDIEFQGEIKQDVHFISTTFSGEADFREATFSREADFNDATFSGEASFSSATFSGEADFIEATFSGKADFWRSTFSGKISSFFGAKFSREASFVGAIFSGVAILIEATFSGEADFTSAKFSEGTNFEGATFSGVAVFMRCKFREKSFYLYWDQVKKVIYCDELFYLDLIRNYQALGMFDSADDAYYAYRKWKRLQSGFMRRVLEFIFLEVTFGYGVKPLKLLVCSLFLWLSFSLYYIGFVRRQDDWRRPRRWRAWNPVYHRFQGMGWCLLHSLDTITPGIDLHSLTSVKQGYVFKEESTGVIWGQRVQKFLGWYLLILFAILFGKIWIR